MATQEEGDREVCIRCLSWDTSRGGGLVPDLGDGRPAWLCARHIALASVAEETTPTITTVPWCLHGRRPHKAYYEVRFGGGVVWCRRHGPRSSYTMTCGPERLRDMPRRMAERLRRLRPRRRKEGP